ncbi:MAG: SDR family NAD(P)-dependent oxidoreductase [Hyphomicrobiales bacterium]
MQDLRDSVVVITGAASGIGAGLARALAREGANLVLADIRDPGAVAAECGSRGIRVISVQCDVGDRAAMDAVAERAYQAFGKVNLLCANAGVVAFAPLLQTPPEQWERAIRVNFFGVLNTAMAFVPRMREQRDERHLVVTASGAGLIASNVLPTGAYCASKFAAVGFAEQLRLELEPDGVGVTILCPGSVKTGILDTAEYAPEVTHLRPKAPGGPTPGREHVRRMDPADVARLVLKGIRENAPYVITHPEMQPGLEARFGAQLAACGKTRAALGLAAV